MNSLFDSTKPLEVCEFKNLNREIGVKVSQPFFHHGLGFECVEITRETITTNTKTMGRIVSTAEWLKFASIASESTVKELDAVISELKQHRDRLAAKTKL